MPQGHTPEPDSGPGQMAPKARPTRRRGATQAQGAGDAWDSERSRS